jgi:hypothetical protein
MKLKVSENKRFLVKEDGNPFFYLGDTAWELFHALSRNEVDWYLETRQKQGFNVVQAVVLSEHDGLRVPNAYGRRPLMPAGEDFDPAKPDIEGPYSYWDHVDYCLKNAAEKNIFIGFLPTWGDKYPGCGGAGPAVFNSENARVYGEWLGNRYKDYWNIIWILGGDRKIDSPERLAIVNAIAEGIKSTGDDHLMSLHPDGQADSYRYVGQEKWLDFIMWQTGHAGGAAGMWKKLREQFKLDLGIPIMDAEPRYEDHPLAFNPQLGYFYNATDVRASAWWHILEGCCGHTYGNHSVWAFRRSVDNYWPYAWEDVLEHEGAKQMRYVKDLMESRPYFERRSAPELLIDEGDATSHFAAARGENYAFVYTPIGLPIKLNMGVLPGKVIKTSWYNPRNGTIKNYMMVQNKGAATFVPESCGKGNDWVLVVDSFT